MIAVGAYVRVMQADEEIRVTKIVRETAMWWIDQVGNKYRKDSGMLAGAKSIRIEPIVSAPTAESVK